MPAWPYLWRLVDTVAPVLPGALAVNIVLFTLGCLAVFLVLRGPLGDSVATVAVVLLIVFPEAQFTLRPGPESLFLLASALALWAAQSRRWWWVAPAATVAALSRPQGVLLLAPLLILALQQRTGIDPPRKAGNRIAVGAALFAPIVGLAAFCLYLGQITGNPLATLQIQKAWDNSSSLPGLAMIGSLRRLLLDHSVLDYYGWNLISWTTTDGI